MTVGHIKGQLRNSPSGPLATLPSTERFLQASNVNIPYFFGGPGGFTGGVQEIPVYIWPFPTLAENGRYLVLPNPSLEIDDGWMLSGCCFSHARIIQYDILDPPGAPLGINGILIGVGFYCQPLPDPVQVEFTATMDFTFTPIKALSLQYTL